MSSAGKPYTKEEDAKITRMKAAGKTNKEIAELLDRPYESIRSRVKKISRPEALLPPPTLPDPLPEAGGPTLPEPHPLSYEPFSIDSYGHWLVLSDTHLPFHDKTAINMAVAEAKKRNVAGVILNGDIMDSGEISRHCRHSDLPRYKDEVEMTRQFLAWIRAQFRNARIIYKQGNHEQRLERYIIERAPAFEGLEGFDLPSLLHLKEYGVEWVGDGRVIYLGKLNVIHGHEYGPGGSSSPIGPARVLYMKAKSVALMGHVHRTNEFFDHNIRGKFEGAWTTGCACFLHPDWRRLNMWNHGFAMVELMHGGIFSVENKKIQNGVVV